MDNKQCLKRRRRDVLYSLSDCLSPTEKLVLEYQKIFKLSNAFLTSNGL